MVFLYILHKILVCNNIPPKTHNTLSVCTYICMHFVGCNIYILFILPVGVVSFLNQSIYCSQILYIVLEVIHIIHNMQLYTIILQEVHMTGSRHKQT